MSNSSKKHKKLAIIAVVGHLVAILALWLVLRENNIQEPVYQKVISAKLTTTPPSLNNLPVLDQNTRDKIEKEKRQKEESEWKKQQDTLKKKYEAEVKRKKEAEAKKKLADKKKAEQKKPDPKKEIVKKKDDSKKKLADKKKAEQLKKQKAEEAIKAREKKAKELADKKRHEKMLADKRAREAADRAANKARQANLGKHVTTDIVNRLTQEWTRLRFSAIEFNDPNDFVKIEFRVNRDGSLISARVVSRAKSSSLNAKAAALIKTISRNGYKFPAFDPQYDKQSISITRNFRTK